MQAFTNEHTNSNLVDIVRYRAQELNEAPALSFYDDRLNNDASVSFFELDRQARAIATHLQHSHRQGERALLLFPPGIDYVTSFLGCLYAGILAVPAYPPQSPREFARLQAIIRDAQATVICTTRQFVGMMSAWMMTTPELSTIKVVATDGVDQQLADQWVMPSLSRNDIAFLQYTSGSTGTPKGVMVSHGNLLHNSELISQCFGSNADSVGVIWLPPYHDMGLIGGIIQPIYRGFPCHLISPLTFLKRPLGWLEMISRHRATISGGPNFAYELAIQRADDAFIETLDLSSWNVAFNGAEVIRSETLDRFAQRFASAGFRKQALLPCYGLAESTLIVTGCAKQDLPQIKTVARDSIATHRPIDTTEKDNARILVGSGKVLSGSVVIVDPETRTRCKPGTIGEIWIANESVAHGYWDNPALTQEVFGAHLSDTGEGPFMRSGDLGFFDNGELFVSGRLKELIILNGRNYYPVDIEASVQDSHDALRRGCGATFSIESEGEERLVVVQEIRKELADTFDAVEVLKAIRTAIIDAHSIRPFNIVLIKHNTLPKTTSGKIQRRATRDLYLDNALTKLSSLQETDLSTLVAVQETKQEPSTEPSSMSVSAMEQIIIAELSKLAGARNQQWDIHQPFNEIGLDSKEAVGLIGQLENLLHRTIDASTIFNYPTIRLLAEFLTGNTKSSDSTTSQDSDNNDQPIAIVGMACKFPGGADTLGDFWKLLVDRRDAIQEIPADRWPADLYYDPNPGTPGKMCTRWGGFVSDVDKFDASLFGISPREAEALDPQQRLLLETSWQALEDARINPFKIAGSATGVFVGISSNDYARLQHGQMCSVEAYSGTGNALSVAANRLSYFYDLRGPSMAIDTACSSSLVALHLACDSLKRGDCTTALVGGVNLILSPDLTVVFSQARMMSPDGRCKTFSEEANGYVRGEGCGVIVLKPLAQAQADGDRIWGLVKGSAINQDGRSNGITAPNGLSQEQVIKRALQNAHLDGGDIDYIETHGTGTPLGDPIEIGALMNVYGNSKRSYPIRLGSVKTQIGHLEAAAGIAGVIKTVLALKYRTLPANLHFTTPSTRIPWHQYPAEVVTQLKSWPRVENKPRYAGVSAFGFGGTNAHVILQAYSDSYQYQQPAQREYELMTLSARTPEALRELAKRHIELLDDGTNLTTYAGAINTSRAVLRCRAAFNVSSVDQLKHALKALVEREHLPKRNGVVGIIDRTPNAAFVFTGQGSQYFGMGKTLYDQVPRFRQVLDRCDRLIQDMADYSIIAKMFGDAEQQEKLSQTEFTQPALFCLEYALADLWIQSGVTPKAVIGHSVGEYAAACIAGVFTLEDGLRLILVRARLMQALSPAGSMMAVNCDIATARRFIAGHESMVTIGVINGPRQIVLSGDEDTLCVLEQRFTEEQIKATRLNVSHGFHSPNMKPMLEEFYQVAKTIQFSEPKLTLISNLSGDIEKKRLASADYWRDHVIEAVQFNRSVETLAATDCSLIVEIGPKPVLTGLIKKILPAEKLEQLYFAASQSTSGNAWETFIEALRTAYLAGAKLDFAAIYQDIPLPIVKLPLYAFEKKRHWIPNGQLGGLESITGGRPQQASRQKPAYEHSLLGQKINSPLLQPGECIFHSEISVESLLYLEQQSAEQTAVFPPTVFFEMALEAGVNILRTDRLALVEVEVKTPMKVMADGKRYLQLITQPRDAESFHFKILSQPLNQDQEPWILHVTGIVSKCSTEHLTDEMSVTKNRINNIRQTHGETFIQDVALREYYAIARELGFSSNFQALKKSWVGSGEALGEIHIDKHWQADTQVLHPALIDASLQVLWAARLKGQTNDVYYPLGMKSLVMLNRARIHYDEPIWVYANIDSENSSDGDMVAHLMVLTPSGEIIAYFHQIVLRRIEKEKSLVQKLQESSKKDAITLLSEQISNRLAIELKLSAQEIDEQTPLVDMGMDSLAAMELLIDIENKLGVEINIMKLMEGINIRELAELIDLELNAANDSGQTPAGSTDIPQKLQCAVELQKSELACAPLFFVHPIGGSVFCYLNLARELKDAIPVVGLQCASIAAPQAAHLESIEEMARSYINEIRQIQAVGPYRIGGWSMGGVIAFEIAKQLKANGDDIATLVIVDALSPGRFNFGTQVDDAFLLSILAQDLGIAANLLDSERLSHGNLADRLQYLLALAKAQELVPARMTAEEFNQRYMLFRANYKALSAYRAEKIDVEIALVKAAQSLPQHDGAPFDLGWSEWTREVTEVFTLNCNHFDLVKAPFVIELARSIKQICNMTDTVKHQYRRQLP